MTETRPLRCAIYTRKSTEEGLDQAFNSLQAQRESGEAYIASQQARGWSLIPEQYNDGGFSGSHLERPALQRFLNDLQAGGIDCVLVYKVDRLSRSLLDFARLMERFDRTGVSFVSVTQEFNTTTSKLIAFANLLFRSAAARLWRYISGKHSFPGSILGHSAGLGYESRRPESFLAACTQPHPCSLVGEKLYTLQN